MTFDVAAIEQRASSATVGPWTVTPDKLVLYVNDPKGQPLVGAGMTYGEQNTSDVEFIASARQDVPALIARIRELEDIVGVNQDTGGEEPDPERAKVQRFIDQRPEYVTAMKNRRGTDNQSVYFRWSGHAEARRQLAQTLGWTMPHEVGDTTEPKETL